MQRQPWESVEGPDNNGVRFSGEKQREKQHGLGHSSSRLAGVAGTDLESGTLSFASIVNSVPKETTESGVTRTKTEKQPESNGRTEGLSRKVSLDHVSSLKQVSREDEDVPPRTKAHKRRCIDLAPETLSNVMFRSEDAESSHETRSERGREGRSVSHSRHEHERPNQGKDPFEGRDSCEASTTYPPTGPARDESNQVLVPPPFFLDLLASILKEMYTPEELRAWAYENFLKCPGLSLANESPDESSTEFEDDTLFSVYSFSKE